MSIKSEEFTKEELTGVVNQLNDFKQAPEHLKEQVQKYFVEFDKDGNGFLDRRELRHFLNAFFTQYKIGFPLTDEYVDAIFREIDSNRDNKIQPNELETYALHFVNQLLPLYEKAHAEKN